MRDCVLKELTLLYGIQMDALTFAQITKSKVRLRDALKFTYTPPVIRHGATIDDPDAVDSSLEAVSGRKKKGRPQKSRSAVVLFQMNIVDVSQGKPIKTKLGNEDTTALSDEKKSITEPGILSVQTQSDSPLDFVIRSENDTDAVPADTFIETSLIIPAVPETDSTDKIKVDSSAVLSNAIADRPIAVADDSENNVAEAMSGSGYITDVSADVDTAEKTYSVDACQNDCALLANEENQEDPFLTCREVFVLDECPSECASLVSEKNILENSDSVDEIHAVASSVCDACSMGKHDGPNAYESLPRPCPNNDKTLLNHNPSHLNLSDCEPYYMDNTCGLLFPNYNIRKNFFKDIIDCSIEDMKHIHAFLTDSCSSTLICIEAVRYHFRNGLLFYMLCSDTFYFFDIDFSYSNFLQPILSTATKIRYLSLNSIPVYHMLQKLGFNHVYVESLVNLFTGVNDADYNVSFAEMFHLVLDRHKPKEQDFYQFAMPLYKDLADGTLEQLKEREDAASYNEKVRRMDYFNRALSTACQLSELVLEQCTGITGLNKNDYQLYFNKDMRIVAGGTLYVIQFQGIDSDSIKTCELYERILAAVYSLNYNCICNAHLFNVSSAGMVIFCTDDGDEFFDILLNRARIEYSEEYQKIPVIDTKRIIYGVR